MVIRSFGQQYSSNINIKFVDSNYIPSWASPYISKGIEYGIINGYSDHIHLNHKIVLSAERHLL